MFQIIDQAERLLEAVDPALRGARILHPLSPYLSGGLRSLVNTITVREAHACTCSVLDCLAASSMPYDCPPGRFFCMYLDHHPEGVAPEVVMTAAVHEAAHHLTDRHPSRDEPDRQKAVRDWWGTWGKDSGGHSSEWARAAAHLAFRFAAIGGVRVPTDLLFGGYVDNPKAHMAGLRGEMAGRTNKPIEKILARNVNHGSHSAGRSPKEIATVKRRRAARPYSWLGWENGHLQAVHKSGKVEIFGGPGERSRVFASQAAADDYIAAEHAAYRARRAAATPA